MRAEVSRLAPNPSFLRTKPVRPCDNNARFDPKNVRFGKNSTSTLKNSHLGPQSHTSAGKNSHLGGLNAAAVAQSAEPAAQSA